LITAKVINLIFPLFGVALASMYSVLFMNFPVSSFVFHSPLLKAKSADLVVKHDGFLFVKEIVHIIHSG